MADYGALGEVVAVSGSLIGAATAVGLAWSRGARWLPPEEAVPNSTKKLASLVCAVVIAVIYMSRNNIGFLNMSAISIFSLCLAILFLIISIIINVAYSFDCKLPDENGKKRDRVLGGFFLTKEGKKISRE